MPAAGPAVQIRPARTPDRRSAPSRSPPIFAETPKSDALGFLKLVAGMLGVGLDELVQRETSGGSGGSHCWRRHRSPEWR